MSAINKKWVLKNRPTGLVKESNFEFIKESIPELNEGDIIAFSKNSKIRTVSIISNNIESRYYVVCGNSKDI